MVSIRKPKTALRFEKPASWWGALWREALPAGNGLIGASVYGRVADETVLLTHGSLNWQSYIGVLPDVSDKLKDVRKLMLDGKVREAEDVLPHALISKNYRPQLAVPLPLCDFKIKMPPERPAREYMRVINMENGEVSVTYRDGTTKFDRSMFVSRVNDCIVYQITRSGQKTIDAEFSFQLHDRSNNRTPTTFTKVPDGVITKYENYFMYFSARSDNGTEFGAVAKISYFGGSQEVTDNCIRIRGATDVLVVIKLFTESQREKEWKSIKTQLAANKATYDKMLKEHTTQHSKLLSSAEFDLDADDRDLSVEALLEKSKESPVPALLEKLWYYARYLFISSARPDGNICAPYGLWCGDYKAVNPLPKASGILQMLYSGCLSGNHAEYLMGVFNFYESVLADLKKNAQRLYGCRGIMVPSVSTYGTGLLGSVEPEDVHFVAGSAMVASLFYRYYKFTGDKKFLKDRALPFMKEASLFYEDFFKLGMDGFYMSCPSYSPDNTPGSHIGNGESKPLGIAINSTIDFAAVRELLSALLEGCAETGLYKDEIAKWQDMLQKLPPYAVNKDGAVREYLNSGFSDNYIHRYASHLYPVFSSVPAFRPETELGKAFYTAAKKRLGVSTSDMTSWGYGYLASAFARMGDGVSAAEALTAIVRHCLMGNLITAENDWRGSGATNDNFWAPYQIQGNMAFASAMTECLAFARDNVVVLLPGYSDFFGSFSVEGLLLEGGIELKLSLDKRKQTLTAAFKSKRAVTIDIEVPEFVRRINKAPTLKLENGVVKGVALAANKQLTIDFRL